MKYEFSYPYVTNFAQRVVLNNTFLSFDSISAMEPPWEVRSSDVPCA